MAKKEKCDICGNELPKRKQRFCSDKCRKKGFYWDNREKKKQYQLDYYHKNKDKVLPRQKSYFKKWYEKNKHWFNEREKEKYKQRKNEQKTTGEVETSPTDSPER